MKRPTLLYLPLVVLFALAAVTLTLHSSRILPSLSAVLGLTETVRIPFAINNGRVRELRPEGESAGMKDGDILLMVDGRKVTNDALLEEIRKTRIGDPVTFTVETDGERREISVTTTKYEPTFGRAFSDFFITLIFQVLLPFVSYLLGFWVAFVRPRDPLAWVLLFMLLGVGSIPMEGVEKSSFIYLFQQTAMGGWGIWMLLFAIYFPERWKPDIRFPWAKWLLIVPLAVAGILFLIRNLFPFFGAAEPAWLPILYSFVGPLVAPLTMTAISLFFAILAIKTSALENKDSRRRLRILYMGTSIAMLPAFVIVVLRLIKGGSGSFFDIVPSWFAITALLLLLLFPLTMAYVIIVERAMDVGVVVRQGLQYALARNGVLALQIVLSIGVILAAVFVSGEGRSKWEQILFLAIGGAIVFLIGRIAGWLRSWVDRRFFREAYNAENILSDLSEQVRTMVQTGPLLEMVSQRISASLHVPQIVLFLREGPQFRPAYAVGFEGGGAPALEFTENAITLEKLRQNEPLTIYADDEENWINTEAGLDGERETLQQLNSQLLLPIGVKEGLSGFISLGPKLADTPYTPNDLRLLRSVASQTGLALENSRLTDAIVSETAQRERLNREVEIAREVQERLFPQEMPPIEGLDYYGTCRPALGVGGDYYDFLELPDGKFGIAVGDVSGKGIAASLLMASLQASLRGAAIQGTDDLAALMSHVNKLVYNASTSNRYATFFYAQYDPSTRKLAYVNAGHNPPFLFRKNGDGHELLKLEEGGPVVGMLPSEFISYEEGTIDLQEGDLLIGYTDGISEAMNPESEEWGEDEMIRTVEANIDLPAVTLAERLMTGADAFANGAEQHDDMTLIIVRVV